MPTFLSHYHAELAEEVIGSAMRVLRLAGLSIEEIQDLLRKTSEQIVTGQAVVVDDEEGALESDKQDFSSYELIWRLQEIPAAKRLARLAKRISALGDLDDPQIIVKAIEIVKESTGPRLETLEWVQREAVKLGLKVVTDRDQWVEQASDSELDQEENIIFLDGYHLAGQFSWHIVSRISRALARTGDREALEAFGKLVLDDTLALNREIKDDVADAIRQLNRYDEFYRYVRAQSGNGELFQSELLNSFIRESGFSGSNLILDSWLEVMAEKREIERYKRSNRWRVVVS